MDRNEHHRPPEKKKVRDTKQKYDLQSYRQKTVFDHWNFLQKEKAQIHANQKTGQNPLVLMAKVHCIDAADENDTFLIIGKGNCKIISLDANHANTSHCVKCW